MKKIVMSAVFLLLAAGVGHSQSGLNEKEPERRQLGAPLFPEAVYIRTITGLDMYHETAEYVTSADIKKVIEFFDKKMPEKRTFIFEDRQEYIYGYLLKTWTRFPDNPDRDDLRRLDREPNVQITEFDSGRYATLISFFERKPDGKAKVQALTYSNTMIRYTFRSEEENRTAQRIVGVWRQTDRDQPRFHGSTLEMRPDGTYRVSLTENNISHHSRPASRSETGRYAVTGNVISFSTERPVFGGERKSGIVTVGHASLSLELVGLPRLTFVRVKFMREPEPRLKVIHHDD